ncbi:hypothetical protein CLAFUW4_03641 [Fulvia fulva]|uniref:uncharacterized protein n=1 Tax=Passalora fulva TaxID=5499 RepID=UPI002852D2C5|nr:uncharacterized protein CLAFUR5_20160 [Fulvia fulva]KAK4632288.1 hypothetical protein CLAFUR4_03629 [Fulvia fulva]KAK4632884.1 hypothetical protein CLAFUR0_03632 [Fulvia fulva]WMI38800.1 hypothetical protein CLAFUR5_20160 [Fulvia fulva]WPV11982.1 hypothetical protein CLAFUW4_03641 [Fulvia fulva]WPV26534.1 hypothetical protein CLAFUW7_03633 [Fulvia fulva]
MNRGNLPGFYFDEEKKKYFPITANHKAPVGAKYSQANVNAEERQSKKRKLDRQHERALKKQTVPAARIFKHPLLGGSGLLREHGARQRNGSYDVDQHKSLAQGLVAKETRVVIKHMANASITDFRYMPDSSKVLLAVRHTPSSHAVYASDWTEPTNGSITIRPLPMHAFYDPIMSLDYTTASGVPYVVASTARPNPFVGNVYIGPLAQLYDDGSIASGYHFNVGEIQDTIWECKVNDWSHEIAVAGSHGCQLHSVGKHMQSVNRLSLADSAECYAADWLNARTLAVGCRRKSGKDARHDVSLWDTRSNGTAVRLKRNARISGIQRLDDSQHHLLVSSSYDISMYDLRVLRKDRPLLTLDHKSAFTKLHMPTLHNDLVAAVDQYNKVQVWSLRTGKHLRTMHNFKRQPGLLYHPRWQQDHSSGAPFLQACLNNTLQQWSWQNSLDEG